jgi:hypothetical protein
MAALANAGPPFLLLGAKLYSKKPSGALRWRPTHLQPFVERTAMMESAAEEKRSVKSAAHTEGPSESQRRLDYRHWFTASALFVLIGLWGLLAWIFGLPVGGEIRSDPFDLDQGESGPSYLADVFFSTFPHPGLARMNVVPTGAAGTFSPRTLESDQAGTATLYLPSSIVNAERASASQPGATAAGTATGAAAIRSRRPQRCAPFGPAAPTPGREGLSPRRRHARAGLQLSSAALTTIRGPAKSIGGFPAWSRNEPAAIR